MIFDGTEKIIGRGAQADVIEYQGYAYKIYKPSYPAEWIEFEKSQQEAVNRAGLSDVKYYDTDDLHIVKMDLVVGDVLEKKVREGFTGAFDILADAFRKIHSADPVGINMPRLSETAAITLSPEEKESLLPSIDRLSAKYKECICHLDMHFLNIMITDDKYNYTIIDWMNARIAPPVFDYARTHVILEEFAKDILPYYESVITPDMNKLELLPEDYAEAIKICCALRQHEK
jgi:hypothetical protein